jgi:hypothetical protein
MGKCFRVLALLAVICVSNVTHAGLPNEELMCLEPQPELDRYRFLRSAALDITGTVPPVEWNEELHELDDVPEAWIDELLDMPEFADRVVRWHRALVWNNLSLVRLYNTRNIIREASGVYWVGGGRSTTFRGTNIACNNVPVSYNVDGSITTDEEGREGYRWIQPHWLPPGEQIKVCAFDAQDVDFSASGNDCSQDGAATDAGCGCGPNLIYCGPRALETQIQQAFVEDLNKRVRRIITNNLPYTELFTSQTAYVNGPIVRYWKSMANFAGGVRNTPVPMQIESLPDLDSWQVDEWVEVDLPPSHAGILTSPAWLLRFQTNRGRASQFQTQFLCAPLKAQGTLPTSDAAIQAEPNLQKKEGCNTCHAVLEPVSAYWGRWTEAGAGHLYEDDFPALNTECYTCATTGLTCSADCNRYYKVKAYHPDEQEFLGQLSWYLFQTEGNQKNVEEGPALLALLEVAGNRLPECAAKTAAQRMLGRDLLEDEQGWVDELVVTFAGSSFSYRELVKAIVMSPIYRRML